MIDDLVHGREREIERTNKPRKHHNTVVNKTMTRTIVTDTVGKKTALNRTNGRGRANHENFTEREHLRTSTTRIPLANNQLVTRTPQNENT